MSTISMFPTIVNSITLAVESKPAENPRDGWPDWTDEVWTITEPPVKTPVVEEAPEPEPADYQEAGSALFAGWVDAFLARSIALPFEADDYRPTSVPEFEPDESDEAEYLALLAVQEAQDEVMAGWLVSAQLEAMEASFDPWDLLNPCELIECGGFHPSLGFEV